MTDSDQFSPQKIFSVSALNRLTREVLQSSIPLLWVSGEVSNFTRAASGHWYFSLKDTNAQVRCVMFKGRNSYVDFLPREGDKVEARASITLYEARGDLQLTVEFIRQAGLGALFEQFEQLKQQLRQEGLFDESRKQPIMQNPKTIGIVTSPDAAALRDVLTTLNRRNPNVKIIIYPTQVQGKDAAKSITLAIDCANKRQEVDTLLVCRGGGNIEDLWQFNEEMVARAISASDLPIISGIGHETDFTIADFVADVRAATPTAAAELACEDINQLKQQLAYMAQQLAQQIQLAVYEQAQKIDYLARRLTPPKQKINNQIDYIAQLKSRLQFAMQQQLRHQQQTLKQLKNSIQQLSPKAVLSRGYAIVHNADSKIISSWKMINKGDEVSISLQDGSVDAVVLSSSSDDEP